MTQLFLNPLTKFTSDNITALPGARLYFFQNNSSTPKAVYADKNKVTSLGVYVEADSAGIFPPIWLDGTYRATLRYSANWVSDPTGVVQTGWPIDNIGDIGNFAAFAAWDSTFTYDITTNTFVTGPDGLYYKSIQNPNLNKTPASNPAYWEQIRFQAVWNPNRSYVENDIVEWEGKLYSGKNIVNVNHEPPNATYWNDLTFNNNVIGDLDVTGNLTVGGTMAGDSLAVTGFVTSSYEGVARRQTTLSIVSDTTLNLDPDLTVSGLTSGWYWVDGVIQWNSNSGGAGNRLQVTFDGDATTQLQQIVWQDYDTTALSTLSTATTPNFQNAGASDRLLTFSGMIRLDSGGVLGLWVSQFASSATAIDIKRGSLFVKRVGDGV